MVTNEKGILEAIERKLLTYSELKLNYQKNILVAQKISMVLLKKEIKASSLMKAIDPNNLMERLELSILETKAG